MFILVILSWSAIVLAAYCHSAALINRVQERMLSVSARDEIVSEEMLHKSFPFLKASCVRDALKQFLPICLKHGVESIDASFRVETAVKLSICEFQASGLGRIPEACKEAGTDSMMDCMIQLESSTQWWTTYSGNYQRLSSICFENSLPFEKDQILSLFLNITNLQTDINENLTKHFHKLMSNVESSAGDHLETIIQLFNASTNQFQDTFKTSKNDLTDDFKEFQEDMQSLMVQNSNIVKEQNVGFMQSMDSLQNIIDGIIGSLKETDISSQITEMRNDDLRNMKQMGSLMQEIVEFQTRSQNHIGNEMKHLFHATVQNMAMVSHEIERSQMRAMEVADVFDELRKSLIPSITEELAPQLLLLKEDLLSDWKSATELINGDLQMWNHQIDNSFQKISLRLNSTMETINDIDRSLSNFKKVLTHITQMFGYLSIFGQKTLDAICYVLTSKYVWNFSFVFVFVKKVLIWLPYRKLLSFLVFYAQIIAKFGIIVIAIYGGSKFGKMIMSINA